MYKTTYFGLNRLLAVDIYHFNAVLTARSHQSTKVSWWRGARLLLESLQIGLECCSINSHFTCRGEFNGARGGRWPKNRCVRTKEGRRSAIQPKLILGTVDGNEGVIARCTLVNIPGRIQLHSLLAVESEGKTLLLSVSRACRLCSVVNEMKSASTVDQTWALRNSRHRLIDAEERGWLEAHS